MSLSLNHKLFATFFFSLPIFDEGITDLIDDNWRLSNAVQGTENFEIVLILSYNFYLIFLEKGPKLVGSIFEHHLGIRLSLASVSFSFDGLMPPYASHIEFSFVLSFQVYIVMKNCVMCHTYYNLCFWGGYRIHISHTSTLFLQEITKNCETKNFEQQMMSMLIRY